MMNIYSMTAFAHARIEHERSIVQLEIRSVNNRYLDLHLRMPDELRFFEPRLRELIGAQVRRGKLEVRLQMQRTPLPDTQNVAPEFLNQIAQQLKQIRAVLPETSSPTYENLLTLLSQQATPGQEQWQAALEQLVIEALAQLQANKKREGQRLAAAMNSYALQMKEQTQRVKEALPIVQQEYQQKIAQRLQEALEQASPEGIQYISGEELSARISQEASIFSLRIDVAEELTRLEAHVAELSYLLGDTASQAQSVGQRSKGGSLGKRLDFLCQEMNREANTLGSKAGSIELTQAAIELKLLIEQIREQAQNIE